jgi:hypothetical protein
MLDVKTANALAHAERIYPTAEFNADLRVQLTCFELSMATAKAKVVRPLLMARHHNEKEEKTWLSFSLDGMSNRPSQQQEAFRAVGMEVALQTYGLLSVFVVAEASAVTDTAPGKSISGRANYKNVVVLAGSTPDMRINSAVIPILARKKAGLLKFGKADVCEFDPQVENQSQFPALLPFWTGYMFGLVTKRERERGRKK